MVIAVLQNKPWALGSCLYGAEQASGQYVMTIWLIMYGCVVYLGSSDGERNMRELRLEFVERETPYESFHQSFRVPALSGIVALVSFIMYCSLSMRAKPLHCEKTKAWERLRKNSSCDWLVGGARATVGSPPGRTTPRTMQDPQRLYPSLNTLQGQLGGSLGNSGRYSPSAYRNRMQPVSAVFSLHVLFPCKMYSYHSLKCSSKLFLCSLFHTPLFLYPAEVFCFLFNYLMSSGQDPSNIYHGLPASSDGFDAAALVPTSSEQAHEQMTPLQQVMAMQNYGAPSHFTQYPMAQSFAASTITAPSQVARYPLSAPTTVSYSEIDTDPRELERFAEHFKQRRIKLGVTQIFRYYEYKKVPDLMSEKGWFLYSNTSTKHVDHIIKYSFPLYLIHLYLRCLPEYRDFRSQFRCRNGAAAPRIMQATNGAKCTAPFSGLPSYFDQSHTGPSLSQELKFH
uniref:POU-specific domain-containing protein n=1 Tax=Heterorhabditis bacteriophora TaxID=37862 RepID=A0A1I7X643_HETBA